MNIVTGVFKAPRNGRYSFALSGIKEQENVGLIVSLRLNGSTVRVGTAYGSNVNSAQITYSLQSILDLKTDDEITLVLEQGTLYDNDKGYTHFTGSLIEEDLTAL